MASCACRSTGASTEIRNGTDSNPADACSRNRLPSNRPERGCPASERARAATLCAIRQERPPTAESRRAKPAPHAPRLGPGLDLCGVRSAKHLARQGLPCRVQHNGCYVELHITVPPPGCARTLQIRKQGATAVVQSGRPGCPAVKSHTYIGAHAPITVSVRAGHPSLARCRRESVLSFRAESKLIANSGRTPPPLSPGSAVARILWPTGTAGWLRGGVFSTANIVPGSRKLFQCRHPQGFQVQPSEDFGSHDVAPESPVAGSRYARSSHFSALLRFQ